MKKECFEKNLNVACKCNMTDLCKILNNNHKKNNTNDIESKNKNFSGYRSKGEVLSVIRNFFITN